MVDVQAMFNQVQMAQNDEDFLCFLRSPEGNIKKKPEEYRTSVPLFGAMSEKQLILHRGNAYCTDYNPVDLGSTRL